MKKIEIEIEIIVIRTNHTRIMSELYQLKSQNPSEHINRSTIGSLMKNYFETGEMLMSFDNFGCHLLYKIKVKDLLNSPISNWEHNRPPDMIRCRDIALHIYSHKSQIDTMFYLSWNNVNQRFEVLDGIHRLTALRIIKKENSIPLDLLDDNDFGSGNDALWLYEQFVLCNIRFNASKGELVEAFTNLNKSQTVPSLYIVDHNYEKRVAIDTIVNEWMQKYKKHFSSSANPNTPNTNRNRFVELLDKIYDKHNIKDYGIETLRKLLDEANLKMASNIPKKASVDAIVKCKETNCYLFLYKNEKLEKLI